MTEHQIPIVLQPSGTLCVSLFIPEHVDYVALLLGVLATLEQEEYYERDSDYDNENALVVANEWRTRTITPLVEALAQGEACPVTQNRKHTFYSKDILNAKTRTSAAFAVVGDSEILHTFTYPNVIIRAYSISMVISSGAAEGRVQVRLGGIESLTGVQAVVHSTSDRELMAASKYGSVSPTSQLIELYFASTGGATITIRHANDIIYEIEEWD